MTQGQLAAAAGVSRRTVGLFEDGLVSDLGIRKVGRILEAVDLTLIVEDRPRTRRPDHLAMAAVTASVGFTTPLSKEEIRRMFATGRLPKDKAPQVRRLLEEAPTGLVRGLLQHLGRTLARGRIERHLRRIAADLDIPAEKLARWVATA